MTSTPGDVEPPAPRDRLEQAREQAGRAAAWAQERIPWVSLLQSALERERFSAAGLLAGGLAYRLFFWIVPLGLVIAAVASFWVEADRTGLERAAADYGIAGATASAAADAVASEAHSRWYFLVIGLALLPWFGSGVVRALHVAHAVAWRLPPEKLRRPLRAGLAFTGLMAAVILVTAGITGLRERAPGPGLGLTLALLAFYAAAIVWLSTHLPSRATSWHSFVPGGLLVGAGMLVVQVAVSFYLAPKLGRSSQLYGTLGAATVVLLWLYLAARLFVAAAFLNAALWERKHPASTAAPEA